MKSKFFRAIYTILLTVSALQVAGCASTSTPLNLPQATHENVTTLRLLQLAPVAVGKFSFDASGPLSADQFVYPRGTPVASLHNGSFAQHLREVLRVELDAAALLDGRAPLIIEGVLLDNELNAPIGKGNAKLRAKFTIKDGANTIYEQTFGVDSAWDSPMYGVAAMSTAMKEYQSLYHKLIARLFADPAFKQALSKQG